MVLPTEYDEAHWLFVTRIVGYIVSSLVLLIFISIVFTSAYLWEQFHILRLNLAISIILGNSAVLLACEGHACFKAITGGVIDGRASVYLSLGWGSPMIALGYNIFMSLMSFGDEPKCFIGWDNMVKW